MMHTLYDLQQIAEVEFSTIIVDSQPFGDKLRLFLVDESYIDIWLSRKLNNRFGFHWERQHVDGTLYRYDNFPDTDWHLVVTYPYHFHNGSQKKVETSPFSPDVLERRNIPAPSSPPDKAPQAGIVPPRVPSGRVIVQAQAGFFALAGETVAGNGLTAGEARLTPWQVAHFAALGCA